MATRAAAAQRGARFSGPRAALGRSASIAVGVLLLVVAAAVALALVSYAPRDPSFDTVTGRTATNLFGTGGAWLADALLAAGGYAAAALVPAIAISGARLMRGKGVTKWRRYLGATIGGTLLAAAAIGLALPDPDAALPAGSGGLTGLIAASAESLSLPDAQSHPAFSYKPETGEEIYLSFLGVPILRGGNTLGVLVVQNRARRIYSDEEVEALQTTAMLLAEMIAGGELQSMLPGPAVLRQPLSLKGVTVTEGVGLGHVVLHEPRVIVTRLVAENVEAEEVRLDEAIAALRESIDRS